MDNIDYVFFFLLAAGILLVCAEVFVPGGVLGALGAIALVGAIVTGFMAFPAYGLYVAVGIVALSSVALALWVRLFPRSPLGKRLMLRAEADAGVPAPHSQDLVGKEGPALTDLHPSGIARLGGRRTDVVTEGEMIDEGETVRVVEVEGIRVVVRRSRKKEVES
ncbi:MAG: hypothetical protein JXR37_19640 [Kiritimatiellae bacterium]|nr:hypothetical protein [Kiritimatiellia bacterium]